MQYLSADIQDAILAHAWLMKGAASPEPPHVTRPLDALERRRARAQAGRVKNKIRNTRWEEV